MKHTAEPILPWKIFLPCSQLWVIKHLPSLLAIILPLNIDFQSAKRIQSEMLFRGNQSLFFLILSTKFGTDRRGNIQKVWLRHSWKITNSLNYSNNLWLSSIIQIEKHLLQNIFLTIHAEKLRNKREKKRVKNLSKFATSIPADGQGKDGSLKGTIDIRGFQASSTLRSNDPLKTLSLILVCTNYLITFVAMKTFSMFENFDSANKQLQSKAWEYKLICPSGTESYKKNISHEKKLEEN